MGETVNPSMMEQFKYLATTAQNSTINDKKVVVVTKGGTYNMNDLTMVVKARITAIPSSSSIPAKIF
jgi:hypothetical protein